MTPASGRPVFTRHAVAVALTLTALLMVVAGVAHAATSVGWGSVYLDEPVAGVVLAVVGAVLATRVPANPVGWLFLAGPPVHRRRYDASRVAESFRAQVRDQVGLETVTGGLVAAARRTVQPSAVAIWHGITAIDPCGAQGACSGAVEELVDLGHVDARKRPHRQCRQHMAV